MRISNYIQGSEEWLASRLGCPSGSGFSKLITAGGKPSTSADGYINQLIAEKLTGQTTEFKVNEWMQRGTDLEPMARDLYELETGFSVAEVGFCKHETLECGISPDGLVGKNGGLEIKCPAPHTHVAYLRDGGLPTTYKQQVQGCLWITGREWWDFMSYHETMPSHSFRVYRDDAYIALLAEEVQKACETIETEFQKLKVKI